MRTKNIFKTMVAATCCLAAVVFASCDNDDNKKTSGLKFSATTATVTPGQSASIVVGNGTAPTPLQQATKNLQPLRWTRKPLSSRA